MLTKAIDSCFAYVPARLQELVMRLPEEMLETVTEIRLRADGPFTVTAGGRNVFLDINGKACELKNAVICSRKDVSDCICLMTKGSMYSYGETIKRGYIPLADGSRAGISGRAISSQSGIESVPEITSINIRLKRDVNTFAARLIDWYSHYGICGTLVFSPPAAGKTTFLRSVAYLLATGTMCRPTRVGIADERGELLIPGGITDTLSGCSKADAIEILYRTMSPEVIVCDEIGAEESDKVINAQNTGVSLIASSHADSLDSLFRRPFMKSMIDHGVFSLFVKLWREGSVYNYEILNKGQL